MANKTLTVLAPRPPLENDTTRHWMAVGIATVIQDPGGPEVVLIRINATPLNWTGELKLVEPYEKKERKKE